MLRSSVCPMITRFTNRIDAGRRLAAKLQQYSHRRDVLVLALPRGGVPVGFEIAKALDLPMDIIVVRKLGTPGQRELAMGAIATGGFRVLNSDVIRVLEIREEEIKLVADQEQQEIARRELTYRGERSATDVAGKTIILVDDGLATGSTMHAAVAALKPRQPARIVVAVPVAPPWVVREFEREADEVVCVSAPSGPFDGVGRWYMDFSQTTDEEVRDIVDRAPRYQNANETSETALVTCS